MLMRREQVSLPKTSGLLASTLFPQTHKYSSEALRLEKGKGKPCWVAHFLILHWWVILIVLLWSLSLSKLRLLSGMMNYTIYTIPFCPLWSHNWKGNAWLNWNISHLVLFGFCTMKLIYEKQCSRGRRGGQKSECWGPDASSTSFMNLDKLANLSMPQFSQY